MIGGHVGAEPAGEGHDDTAGPRVVEQGRASEGAPGSGAFHVHAVLERGVELQLERSDGCAIDPHAFPLQVNRAFPRRLFQCVQ